MLVKDNPGIRRKELSEKAGKSISTVARQIIELQEKGLIEHKGSNKKGGYYVK
ncbi:MAG: winged helix-turn-helix domain-containing protein [Bacteroidales bacterium]|nr:winged helix-turn-helix domain-containing protein [Candidatus Cacconaster merdequi]